MRMHFLLSSLFNIVCDMNWCTNIISKQFQAIYFKKWIYQEILVFRLWLNEKKTSSKVCIELYSTIQFNCNFMSNFRIFHYKNKNNLWTKCKRKQQQNNRSYFRTLNMHTYKTMHIAKARVNCCKKKLFFFSLWNKEEKNKKKTIEWFMKRFFWFND